MKFASSYDKLTSLFIELTKEVNAVIPIIYIHISSYLYIYLHIYIYIYIIRKMSPEYTCEGYPGISTQVN